MPKPANKDRDAARQAIRDAIRDHGPTDGPAIARRSFPGVNADTWKGWVAAEKRDARSLVERVLADVPMPARGPGRPPLDVAPMPMPVSEIKAIADGRRQLARGTTTCTPMSFFDRFDELERDLAKVRSACIRIDPATGNERIVNPAALLLCVREGRANLKLAMEHSSAAFNVDTIREYELFMGDVLLDAIKDEDPALAKRVIARLREASQARKQQINDVAPGSITLKRV